MQHTDVLIGMQYGQKVHNRKDRTILPTNGTNKCLYIFVYVNTFLYLCSEIRNKLIKLTSRQDTTGTTIMNTQLFEMLKKTNEFLLEIDMADLKPDTYGTWVMKDGKPELFITNTEIDYMKQIIKKLK